MENIINVLIESVLWFGLLFALAAPILVPYLIAIYDGRRFFTTLTGPTGKIIGVSGKKKVVEYTDKNGAPKKGEITDGWTYHNAIVPRGYKMILKGDLRNKREIVEVEDDWDPKHPYNSLLRHLGIYWVGPLPMFQTVIYMFAWGSFSDSDKGEDSVKERKEPTDFFYVGPVEYGMYLEGVEIAGNIQVNLPIVIFGQIVCPELAFANNVRFLEQIQSKIKAETETFFRQVSYDNLKTKEVDERFQTIVMELAKKLRTDLGFLVREARLRGIGGELPQKISNAAQAKFVAEKEGEAALIAQNYANRVKISASEAEKEKEKNLAEAEQTRIERVYGTIESHPNGLEIRRMEMMEKASGKGNTIVFDSGGRLSQSDKNTIVATAPLRNNEPPASEEKTAESEPLPYIKLKKSGKKKRG